MTDSTKRRTVRTTKLQAIKFLPRLLMRLIRQGMNLHSLTVVATISSPKFARHYNIIWNDRDANFAYDPIGLSDKAESLKIRDAIEETMNDLSKSSELNSSPWVLFRVADGKATALMRFSKHSDALHRANQMNAARTGSSYGVLYLSADFLDIQQSA